MPYLNLQTNIKIEKAEQGNILRHTSKLVADVLGKPEDYVMVAIKDSLPMIFAGSEEPLAFLELKSIGLQANRTKEFAKQFCDFVTQQLGIPGNRVYVKFNDAQRSMWGWNGNTFD